ncbi:uncharacterized protein LOC120277754 [Dioscorea cayenensis subsp. rotundata]|uniref:Uncharacterized protein LOC120277754 n=1 Tax=Dioscorea cayennensis subsp. rotundata TaxID=55577 RepID=A0AB40CKG3_DIOCR|nr:uncharacterized protein LOC120277754 [Dioscorea cayenensis subsp. rotundata]
MRSPSTQIQPYIVARSKLYLYFKDCIGALDGTHIHASVPTYEVAAFRGRKPYPTQNVLTVVDFDLRFTYILAGWEGSAHDSLVLRDALERPNGLKVPEGKYYVVDAGYATRPGFIPPYRGVRYHLKEFGSRTPANSKELFNLRHSSARTSIERAFGSLKDGFIPSEEDWIPQQTSQNTIREQREEAQEWAARRDQIAAEIMEGYNVEMDSQNSSAKKPTTVTSGHKRWTPTKSRYFIRFMASQVEQGLKVDKGFKPQAIHAVIRAMRDTFGVPVTEANVGNHLRTIRRRWARIKKLKEMSGMCWDNNLKMIVMGEAEYRDYVKVHAQDELYLNKPIEDYDLIEAICGNDQANGRHAIQFENTIGVQMDFNIEQEESHHNENYDDVAFGETNAQGNASPGTQNRGSPSEPMSATSPQQKKKGKAKRKANTEDYAICELATTIKDAFESVKSSRSLSFAKELSTKCKKLQKYGYSIR